MVSGHLQERMYKVVRQGESQTPTELRTVEYQKYCNYILSHWLSDISFEDRVKILTSIFGENVSIFQMKYQVFNLAKNIRDDFSTYAEIAKQEFERSRLKVLTEDQFKSLIFVLGLKSSYDQEIRAKMLAKLEQDPDITLQPMSEECQGILNWWHDSAQIEENEVPMEI